MKKQRFMVGIVAAILLLGCTLAFALESSIQPTGLIRYNKAKAFQGYTLVTSNTSNRAFLIDTWQVSMHFCCRMAICWPAARRGRRRLISAAPPV